MAFPPIKLPFSFIIFYFFLLSSALDMSIITYDHNHNHNRGLPNRSEDEVLGLYTSWLVEHAKVYNSIGEKEKRFETFKDNLKFIDDHNSVRRSYKLGLNYFADMTDEEYQSVYLSGMILDRKTRLNNRTTSDRYRFKDDEELPDSIDWRSMGVLAPVKNQELCSGGSWAFSAVAAVEGVNKIVTGDMITLSEQDLIDCDLQLNHGCRGGNMDYAFQYIIDSGGIETEDDYPYTGRGGTCHPYHRYTHLVSIDAYEHIPMNDEKSLQKVVANQPVSVAIDARNINFRFYKSGIYNGPCGTNLNQGLNAVGYGSESGKDYWILRNSWGDKWGERGYVRIHRNVPNTPAGKCGIALQGSYPIKNADTVQ